MKQNGLRRRAQEGKRNGESVNRRSGESGIKKAGKPAPRTVGKLSNREFPYLRSLGLKDVREALEEGLKGPARVLELRKPKEKTLGRAGSEG
jgi:hypothetical protein